MSTKQWGLNTYSNMLGNMFNTNYTQMPTGQGLVNYSSYFRPEGMDNYFKQLQGIDPNLNLSNTQPSTLQNIMGYAGAASGIMEGLTGLASAYLGLKNYNLAKKQFGFQKGLANRNLANQAKVINTSYDNAAQVAAGMIGSGGYDPSRDSAGTFGMTDPAVAQKIIDSAKEKYVDGSPI